MDTEIPTEFYEWSPLRWKHCSDSEVEALMGAGPFEDPGDTWLTRQPLREAVADCIEQLSEEDRFVLEAIWFEGVTVRVLAERLGLHKSRTHRIAVRAKGRLGALCAEHPLIAQRIG